MTADPSYDRVEIPKGASGFGLGVTRLRDTRTCTPVSDPQAFSYDWCIGDTRVVEFAAHDSTTRLIAVPRALPTVPIDSDRIGPGSTIVHVTAQDRVTGDLVATTDIPVTVG